MKFTIERVTYANGINCKNAKLIEGKQDEYEIEINSLDELIKLVDEVGNIIIEKEKYNIIIYDDYIE